MHPCLQAQGFVEGGKVRTIPLEIMVKGDKVPVYEETLEENGRWVLGGSAVQQYRGVLQRGSTAVQGARV